MSYIKKGKVTKLNWPKGTDQSGWLELRAQMSGTGDEEIVRLGASEVSVATGSNTFQCAQRLFHSKTGFHKKDFINEILVGGHLLEPVIARRWEGFVPGDMEQSLRNSLDLVRVNRVKKAEFFLLNDAYPYLSVSLDYVPQGPQFSPFTGEKYPALTPHEFKSTNENYYRLWPAIIQGDNKIKIARPYLEQINIQMLVSNTKLALFHVLIDGRHYSVVEIERDDELLEEILPKIEDYVERCKKGKRLVTMMNEILDEGGEEDSPLFQTYLKMYYDNMPEFGGQADQLELAYELEPAAKYESDQFKKATSRDDTLLESYLEQNVIIKEAGEMKIKLRSELVHNCGKWQGIRHSNGETRMINRRESGTKKAYFDIR